MLKSRIHIVSCGTAICGPPDPNEWEWGAKNMKQLHRIPRRATQSRPEPATNSGGQNDGTESGGGMVQVVWGSLMDDLDVAGMSVDEVVTLLRDPYHLAPGAIATVNGVEADPSTRLNRGDTLEFVRAAGEKGGG